jgi:hypothetical protein
MFAAVHESVHGTKRRSGNVCFTAALGDKRTSAGSTKPFYEYTAQPLSSVSSFRRRRKRLLDQQAFGLEQKLETDHGFDRTPLVADCFKALRRVLPCAAGAAQHHLSNELQSFACAAQYLLRARADTQLRTDLKVRHAVIMPQLGPSSLTRGSIRTNASCERDGLPGCARQ